MNIIAAKGFARRCRKTELCVTNVVSCDIGIYIYIYIYILFHVI